MNIEKVLTSNTGAILTLAVVGVGVAYYAQRQAKAALNAVNPTNGDNIFASGVDKVGAQLTGNENFKLGAWVYDLLHPTVDLTKPQSYDSSGVNPYTNGTMDAQSYTQPVIGKYFEANI